MTFNKHTHTQARTQAVVNSYDAAIKCINTSESDDPTYASEEGLCTNLAPTACWLRDVDVLENIFTAEEVAGLLRGGSDPSKGKKGEHDV